MTETVHGNSIGFESGERPSREKLTFAPTSSLEAMISGGSWSKSTTIARPVRGPPHGFPKVAPSGGEVRLTWNLIPVSVTLRSDSPWIAT